jgi:MFS-type transporter involved in bile tolerance (Atg22 family)
MHQVQPYVGAPAKDDDKGSVPYSESPLDNHPAEATIEQGRRTRLEKYAYYAYFFANNGVGPYNYSSLLFQNLIFQAGFDPNVAPVGSQPCGDDGPCHVFWAGGTKDYASVVNIASGLTFLGQALFFIVLGATADYGTWSPWILRISTVVYSAFQFGYLGVKTPDTWGSALALYIFSNIGWAISFTFFVALFPKLAADQPVSIKAQNDRNDGRISDSECDARLETERSKIMNHSWAWNNVGAMIGACLCVAALKGINADASTENNNLGYSVCVALFAGLTLVFSLPWFFLEKRRPGKPVPQGTSIVAIGLRNYWKTTVTMAVQLPQAFLYVVIFFFLNDAVNTLMTQVIIAQSSVVSFSATGNTYFLIIQGVSWSIFPYIGVWLQMKLGWRTKTMLHISNIGCCVLAIWGTAGIWTTTVGYHNEWEFWLYSSVCGAALGIQWSYSQAFMGELVPKGEENHFFSLLGVVSKGGSWIGPIVSSALIDRTQNSWVPFGFIALLIAVSSVLVVLVDEVKGRADCVRFLESESKQSTHSA